MLVGACGQLVRSLRWSNKIQVDLARQCLPLQSQYGGHAVAPPFVPTRILRRGAKSSTRVKLDDLPQGIIPAKPLEPLQDEPAYPTVVQQARRNMRAFEHCVLLTRVGNFYEVD